jgi:hypothetical protein
MDKKKRIQWAVIILILLFFTTSMLGVKFKSFGRPLLALNNTKYYFGDLYELSKLLRFKDSLYVNKEMNNSDIKDAEIITMGDSFFEVNFETPIVATELAKLTGKKVHHVKREDFLKADDNPLVYLKKIGYTKGDKKYLVLETAERYALERSVNYLTDFIQPGSASSGVIQRTRKIRSFIEPAYLQYFFYNNRIIAPFDIIGKNFRFEVLKEIPASTPVYIDKPQMLFYYEDVNFNKRVIEQQYIDMMANNVKTLKSTLKEKYNIELIYVLMPTKYTIYGRYDKNYTEYNNFVPRAYGSLIKNGINTSDLYDLYMKEKNIDTDLLYYKGDSHFTPRAKNILLKEIIKFIK